MSFGVNVNFKVSIEFRTRHYSKLKFLPLFELLELLSSILCKPNMSGRVFLEVQSLAFGSVFAFLGLQSISRDVADSVSHPRRLDPTMVLITYSFVLYLEHGRHNVKCKPSMQEGRLYCKHYKTFSMP